MARGAAGALLLAVALVLSAGHGCDAFRADELSGMKFSALSRLAEKVGVPADKVDAAMEEDSPKKALIALLTPLAEKEPAATEAAEEESPTRA